MTEIRLHNAKTRRKEVFTPLDVDNVRMYLCGPTVYDRAHLGNARNVILFDVLQRLLRHVYGADHVTYVRNITDVDDKINAEALRRQQAGAAGTLEDLIAERTAETVAWYHADMAALGCAPPDHEPRATEYIPQMIAMTEVLIARGHAYARDGHVLFRVRSYAEYGALSGRSVDDMIAGARVEVAPFKEDPMDFVLWKPSSGQEPGWDSPWGKGRPGWHIECSAMSHALLGASFDIHGGGLDLQFPHHENEVAQSACAHPEGSFAQVWLHNEMLMVEGRKMSKSLGNFFTVRDLLDQGVPGEVIRLVFLGTHYRSPMDWTEVKKEEAVETLRKWRRICGGAQPRDIDPEMMDYLSDDMNTSGALGVLHRLAAKGNAEDLLASAALLGLLTEEMGGWAKAETLRGQSVTALREVLIERKLAREKRDFARADFIREILLQNGISLKDQSDGKVLPSSNFEFVNAFYRSLSTDQKRDLFGTAYNEETNTVDGGVLSDAYAVYVAAIVLESLK